MTTGAVALVGALTLGFGTTGAGVALVTAGAGTTLGDGTVGAVASVGAAVGAGPVAGDIPIGAVALAGAAMVTVGTEDIIEAFITEVSATIEVTHTTEEEEGIQIQ